MEGRKKKEMRIDPDVRERSKSMFRRSLRSQFLHRWKGDERRRKR